MTDILLEDGIPLPPRPQHYKNKADGYPLEQMHVGQSFLIPDSRSLLLQGPSSGIARWAKRRPGYQFEVRKTPAGIRVWCVKSPHDTPAAKQPSPQPSVPTTRTPPAKANGTGTRARHVRGSRY